MPLRTSPSRTAPSRTLRRARRLGAIAALACAAAIGGASTATAIPAPHEQPPTGPNCPADDAAASAWAPTCVRHREHPNRPNYVETSIPAGPSSASTMFRWTVPRTGETGFTDDINCANARQDTPIVNTSDRYRAFNVYLPQEYRSRGAVIDESWTQIWHGPNAGKQHKCNK